MNKIQDIINEFFIPNPLSRTAFQKVIECDSNGEIHISKWLDAINALEEEYPQFSLSNFYTLLGFSYEEGGDSGLYVSYSFFSIDGLYTIRRFYKKKDGVFYYYKDKDLIGFEDWRDIKSITLIEEDGFSKLRFFFHSIENTISIISKRFGTPSKEALILVKTIIEKIVAYVQGLENFLITALEKDDVSLASNLLEDISYYYSEYSTYEDAYLLYKAQILHAQSRKKEAYLALKRLLEKLFESHKQEEVDGLNIPYVYEIISKLKAKDGDLLSALNCIAYSEEHYDEINMQNEVALKKDEVYSNLITGFTNIKYDKRKLIYIAKDVCHTNLDNLVILKKDELAKDISFPIGHPHINEVYACHPLRTKLYIPLKDFQKELFLDKVNEFTYLLQCLGATKLNISSQKGNALDTSSNSNLYIDGEVDIKVIGGSADFNKNVKKSEKLDSKLSIEKAQTFTPTVAPYIPDDLIWFKTELSWKRLADQRMNGNINHHTEVICSTQNQVVSNQEITALNVEFKSLLAKAKVNYNNESSYESNSREVLEWVISVDFMNKDLLLGSSSDILSNNSNKEKYKEEVLFMLEDDGVIDDNERHILKRKMKKLDITDEEAIVLENEAFRSFYNENEIKYIDEIKEFIEEGKITDIELKMLNRYANRLNINSEQKKKIDKVFLK